MTRSALITGVTGQDGAYLSRFLVDKGYKVYGGVRRTSSSEYWRLEELGVHQDIEFVALELAEDSNIIRVMSRLAVDEVYNLAAQSFVGTSFEQPVYTSNIDGIAVCRLLEAIRLGGAAKFYQASTSEMFGRAQIFPQDENTPFFPRSPYGVAKLFGYWITRNYRESYDLFACNGILFNHESPLRGIEFVTRKITSTLARIRHGDREPLRLGNLNAKRDWGFAGDYVEGMWMMLQAAAPEDFVLATGETHTVREFVDRAAAALGFDLEWRGEGVAEEGIDRTTGHVIVRIDPRFYRPAEVDFLVGDAKKALKQLGWRPKSNFEQLVEMMVRADSDRVAKRQRI